MDIVYFCQLLLSVSIDRQALTLSVDTALARDHFYYTSRGALAGTRNSSMDIVYFCQLLLSVSIDCQALTLSVDTALARNHFYKVTTLKD